MSENKITLKQILENPPVEIEVPGVGKFLVREPTRKDRIEAREEARKLPYWKDLTDIEQFEEINVRIVVRTIVEPKMTLEDLQNMPLSKQTAIVDTVSAFHNKRILDLYEKRRKLLEDFLGQTKEGKASSSSLSYSM